VGRSGRGDRGVRYSGSAGGAASGRSGPCPSRLGGPARRARGRRATAHTTGAGRGPAAHPAGGRGRRALRAGGGLRRAGGEASRPPTPPPLPPPGRAPKKTPSDLTALLDDDEAAAAAAPRIFVPSLMPPTGSLADTDFPDLIHGLHDRRWTGTIELNRGRVDSTVTVQNGRLTFATSTNRDERLGELLLRKEKITLRQYYEAGKAIRK